MNAKQKQVRDALKVLQDALVNRYGDDASHATQGEGCSIEIRASGIDVMDQESAFVTEDSSPAEVAELFYDNR